MSDSIPILPIEPAEPDPENARSNERRLAAEDEQALRDHSGQARGRGRTSRIERWAGMVAAGVVLLALGVLIPVVAGQRKPADRTTALSHIHAIGTAMIEFDAEYGRYPDAATLSEVLSATGTSLKLGDASSNQLFRQLIAAGVQSEQIFYARVPGCRKPDNDLSNPATVLAPGECAFSYVAGRSSGDSPDAPLVLASMIRGTTRFDPEPFGGMAVVLMIGGFAQPLNLDPAGRALYTPKVTDLRVSGGEDLLDPGRSYWAGRKPDLKWPE